MLMTCVVQISEVTVPQREVELALRAHGFQPPGTRSPLTFAVISGGFRGFKHHRSCLCPGKLQRSDTLVRGVICTGCFSSDIAPLVEPGI